MRARVCVSDRICSWIDFLNGTQYHTANRMIFIDRQCISNWMCIILCIVYGLGELGPIEKRTKTRDSSMICLIFIKSNRICSDQTFQQIYLWFWRASQCNHNGILLVFTTIKLIDCNEQYARGWMDACALSSVNIISKLTQRDFSYELDDYNKCK